VLPRRCLGNLNAVFVLDQHIPLFAAFCAADVVRNIYRLGLSSLVVIQLNTTGSSKR
jgi:hypothetical protein